ISFAPMANFACIVGGSVMPQALSIKARSRLTPNLWVTYSSSEAGLTAVARASQLEGREGSTGFVLPWVTLEIVDKDGRALPPGQTGEVRVKSPEMLDGYLDNNDREDKSFRDGWFYPGDLGVLGLDGMLTIEGRTDEVMNFGGEKYSPLPIEETL